MSLINMDSVPATMEEAVNALHDGLTPEDIATIKTHSPECSPLLHYTAGRQIRNVWSFWEWDTPIKRDCIEKYRIAHPDDMSGLLITWVMSKVQGVEFDPVAYCERFHEHWAREGMTSVEAGTPSDKH